MTGKEKTPVENFQSIADKFSQRFEISVITDSETEKKTRLTHQDSTAGLILTFNVSSGLTQIEHYFLDQDGGEVILENLKVSDIPNALSLYLKYNRDPLLIDELISQFDILSDRFDQYMLRANSMKKVA